MNGAKTESTVLTITIGLLVVAFVLAGMNLLAIKELQATNGQIVNNSLEKVQANAQVPAAGLAVNNNQNLPDVIPKGVPKVYGQELGISFDDVSVNNPQAADQSIAKLAEIDKSLNLAGPDLDRYIRITNSISCEYCCGAPAITDQKGNAACGCAHSYAMRGLAKYLINRHGKEYSDEQILEELGKWKTLFFPDAIALKAKALSDKGIELSYINLASNNYRGAEKQSQSSSGGQMVGGC